MRIVSSTTKYIIAGLMLSACHRGMICPAFQSSFILDDSVRTEHFSLFKADTSFTPKQFITDKSRYGIIDEISYSKRYNDIKTVQMVTVFPPGETVSMDSAYVDPLAAPDDPFMAPADSTKTPIISNQNPQ